MARPHAAGLPAGIACAVLLALLSACQDSGATAVAGPPPASPPAPPSEPPRVRLPTRTVATADIPILYGVPGTVVSDERIELSSRVVGFIRTLEVREGSVVKTGELLVQIDPTDIDEAIRQGQAGLAAARNDLADAEHDVAKYATLARQGWAATEVLRKARVRRDIARTAITRAEAALAAAQAQRGYAAIVSPVDGVVVARHRSRGDMATTGAPILTIESRQPMLFRVHVAESALARVQPAMPVAVRIDALAGRTFQGRVQRIVPSGDPATRRYEVTVALPPDPALIPGMFGRAEIVLGTDAVPVIPRAAKVRYGGLDGVFVVTDDRVARFRWLRLGREWNGGIEVTAGLVEGERILARADGAVRDGAIVLAGGDAP